MVPALRHRFRLVLIDNRGSGRSTTPDRDFGVADMAQDVAAVCFVIPVPVRRVLLGD